MTRVDENIHFPCASLLPLDLHFESLLMLSAGRASTTSKFIYVFNPKRSTFKIYNTVNSRSSWKTIRIGLWWDLPGRGENYSQSQAGNCWAKRFSGSPVRHFLLHFIGRQHSLKRRQEKGVEISLEIIKTGIFDRIWRVFSHSRSQITLHLPILTLAVTFKNSTIIYPRFLNCSIIPNRWLVN